MSYRYSNVSGGFIRPKTPLTYNVISRPTTLPVTVAEVREHLQLYSDTSFDTYIEALIFTAVEVVNTITDQYIGDTTIESYNFDLVDFMLPHFKISSITSLQYYDRENNLQLVSASDYFLDNTEPLTVMLRFSNNYNPPEVNQTRSNPVIARYVTSITTVQDGQTAIAEQDVIHALYMLCEDLFRNRGSTASNVSNRTYLTAENLLEKYKREIW